MKKVLCILFAFSLYQAYGQRTLQQLNERIYQLPQNRSIEMITRNSNETETIDSVKVGSFTLPNKINQSTIVKYDDRIHPAIQFDKSKFFEHLSIDPKNTTVDIIPEYHVELPSDEDQEEPLIFTPIITSSNPLIYDGKEGYKSNVSFILFSENRKSGDSIKTPVNLEIASDRLITKPRRMAIEHINLPSTDVEIFAKEPLDSVGIRIITNNAPKGYTHYLNVTPFLDLRTNEKTIQGLGIEEAKFIVRFRGSSSSEKEQISISSSTGEVEPESFLLAYNEAKTVSLRSQGLDDIILTASATSSKNYSIADSNTLVIHQKFPFMFLGFALAGGLLGVLIRVGFEGIKKYPVRMMLGGLLMGLLGSLAYYGLGVNLLDLEVSATFNEFAVLTFSALCSIILQPFMLKRKILE